MLKIYFSPTDLVIKHIANIEKGSQLCLVTGESGVGKTSWCQELICQARKAGLQPAGLISPAVFDQGIKIGIELTDIGTGEKRRLATKKGFSSSISNQAGLIKHEWLFDKDTLVWGNRILERLSSGELLILDELGPLEFQDNEGFTAGLTRIDKGGFRLTCVVVRPTLLQNAQKRWPWAQVISIIDQADRDQR